ncbi:trans-resveratrol di-O-methyltransferase-like [Rhodamnia argentea]|uniref:Trans-resveratrol di-O-methyltransferase-like n=1 Tax=Rhodamnia argentea TaxID=178133 RepID=A0ABM3GRQ9_9MYRT|nr:trans-resveratrol di-O-methyltransferase-like [Rhodamnia argentea]
MDSVDNGVMSESEIVHAHAHVWTHAFYSVYSMSLKCAIELGIPDALHRHGHPMTLPELAAALSVPASKTAFLRRLMAALAQTGFVSLRESAAKNDQEQLGLAYSLTPISHAILRGEPGGLSPMVSFMLDPIIQGPLHCLSEWLKSESPSPRTPFLMQHGKSLWEYAAQDERLNRSLNEAMASDGPVIARLMVEKHGRQLFQGLRTVVDVGGGIGGLAREAAQAFPQVEWRVLDLPHVVAGLEGTRNLNFVSGDMFKAVPPADAVLLKWILHDWSDDESVKILKRCKEAVTSNGKKGKVMVIEVVMGDESEEDEASTGIKLCFDMLMMSIVPGQERNEEEWAKLFQKAGFTEYRITPLVGFRSLIEVYP